MQTRLTATMAAAALLFAAGPAHAESNFTPEGYPDPKCGDQPQPPKRPEQFQFRAELEDYNKRVSAFNAAEKRYIQCIEKYLENAASDIRLIREKVDAAIRSAGR